MIKNIFPKSRAEIIRLLFSDSNRSLHLRDLARLSGLAIGTIQREIANLRDANLVIERRDGNRLYFKANTAHPIFTELQSISLKTMGLGPQLAKAFEDLDGIQLAFVYGSYAEGTAGPESDIDLFVIGDIGLRKLSPHLREVADMINREINPSVMTASSYLEKKKSGDVYIHNVTKGRKLWIVGNDDELATMA